MTVSATSARNPERLRRIRGSLAALAVVGIAGTAIIAPLADSRPAVADSSFYERIHQEFVPENFDPIDIDLAASPAEELPPEPEPEPVSAAIAIPMYTGGGSPAEWMAAAGIPESDWGYVDAIIRRESGWNPNATNSSSGACGLAQALPCEKVPGGNGYDPVANLIWANQYAQTCVSYRPYCGWAGAYAFWEANHWW